MVYRGAITLHVLIPRHRDAHVRGREEPKLEMEEKEKTEAVKRTPTPRRYPTQGKVVDIPQKRSPVSYIIFLIGTAAVLIVSGRVGGYLGITYERLERCNSQDEELSAPLKAWGFVLYFLWGLWWASEKGFELLQIAAEQAMAWIRERTGGAAGEGEEHESAKELEEVKTTSPPAAPVFAVAAPTSVQSQKDDDWHPTAVKKDDDLHATAKKDDDWRPTAAAKKDDDWHATAKKDDDWRPSAASKKDDDWRPSAAAKKDDDWHATAKKDDDWRPSAASKKDDDWRPSAAAKKDD
eukprot:Hpha_TRINITY_DN14057_c0_g1::TRINITY_DN14057_c0_g1_i1::g.44424::m.44424